MSTARSQNPYWNLNGYGDAALLSEMPPELVEQGRRIIEKRLDHEERMWYMMPEFERVLNSIGAGSRVLVLSARTGLVPALLRGRAPQAEIHMVDSDRFVTVPEAMDLPFHGLDICFEPLPFEENYFDFVFLMGSLEHLENPFYTARQINSVTKPGAVLVFSYPNGRNVYNRLLYLLDCRLEAFKRKNNHITYLPPDVFNKVFRGWKVESQYFKKRYGIPLRFLARLGRIPHPATEFWSDKTVFILRKENGVDARQITQKHIESAKSVKGWDAKLGSRPAAAVPVESAR